MIISMMSIRLWHSEEYVIININIHNIICIVLFLLFFIKNLFALSR